MPRDAHLATRRRLLLVIGGLVGGGAVAAGFAVSFQSGSNTLRRVKQNLHSRVYALPTGSAPGPLDATVLETLVTAVVALLDMPVERTLYADFYSRRSASLPGHRELYQRAATQLDQASNKRTGENYLSTKAVIHGPLAREVLLFDRPMGKASELWYAVTARDHFLFDRYIARAAFDLFAHTELYVHLGYPTWPGTPTGVESYLRFLAGQVRSP